VGLSGEVLDEALAAAGIGRREVYVTNAVKHFKFLIRGWRRWHKQPNRREVDACRAWLEAELELCKPTVLVCLGATASQALLGATLRVTTSRGKDFTSPHALHTIATVHPSSILSQPTPEARHTALSQFVADLTLAASLLGG
jgi:DNA polymerase